MIRMCDAGALQLSFNMFEAFCFFISTFGSYVVFVLVLSGFITSS